MSKPSRLIASAALAVALAVPAFLYAAASPHGAGPSAASGGMAAHADHFLNHIGTQLNLSADQKDKVKAVFTAHQDQLQTQMTQLHQARVNLANAIHADAFDENAIRTAAASVGQAEADFAVARGRMFAEVRPLLTPDQQAKAKELMSKHLAGGAEGWSHQMHQMHPNSTNGSSNPSSQQ